MNQLQVANLTPHQIVDKLNEYIIGQDHAKRQMAIALRNRYRRSLLNKDLQEMIIPKNILMIGSTGVGKTEIARQLAKIVSAPFVKVEATKYTEVGYVGRDVESMVRDLVEASIRLIKTRKSEAVKKEAVKLANEEIAKIIVPSKKKQVDFNPLTMLMGQQTKTEEQPDSEIVEQRLSVFNQLEQKLLEDQMVTIKVPVEKKQMSMLPPGMESLTEGMNEALSAITPQKYSERTLKVSQAREILTEIEVQKLLDTEDVYQEALKLAEQQGIIFIDEIDKIAVNDQNHQSGSVSRQGVQRDILPIVEGSVVKTKYGTIKTDHILFVGAGAFHIAKPKDLIPELQGRFPIRVELEELSQEDLYRILVEPKFSLVEQYTALLATEGLEVMFTEEALQYIAKFTWEVNTNTDNIGARRLHTIIEKVLEELSFEASELANQQIEITKSYVENKMSAIVNNRDLSEFIL